METKWTRLCPKCGKEIIHKTKYGRDRLDKLNKSCRSCAATEANKKGRSKMFVTRYATKGKNCGKDNAFFGKKHTEETKNKIRKSNEKNKQIYKSLEFRSKISKAVRGKNNPMYGRTFYDTWLEKFGKEIADKKLKDFKDRASQNNKGDKNPMYGKPTPNGAGNGWSGWYNNHFFRSLKELSYIVNILEKNGHKWISAESIKINYIDWKGDKRTYSPDFLVNENTLVEIKPEKLKSSITVRLKQKAAVKYCKEKGWAYEIIDVPVISPEHIKKLYCEKKIRFTKRYDELYRKIIENLQV